MANTDPEQARGKAGLAAAYGGIAFGLLGGIAVLVARVRAACHGDFTYPLDDTYIHMALAKNLEASGVWGVSPEGFSGSTSSPLWAMVLAWAFSVLGPTVWAPLVLNILLSLGVVWLWTGWVLRRGLPVWATAVTVLAGVALTPLPALAVLGMEHVLQVLTTSALVFSGARVLGGARGGPLLALGEHSPRKWLKARDWREQWPPGARFRARTVPAGVLAGWRGSWPWNCGNSAPRLARGVPSARIGGGELGTLCVLAALATGARYEALFVTAGVAVLLVLHRRLLEAVAVVGAGVAPAVLYGVVAHAHGWPVLPIGLLLSMNPVFSGLGGVERVLGSVESAAWLVPVGLNAAAVWRRWHGDEEARAASVLFLGAAGLHACFSRSNVDTYRYDSYLVGLGVLLGVAALAAALREVGRPTRAPRGMAAVVGLACLPLVARAWAISSRQADAASDVRAFVMEPAKFLAASPPAGVPEPVAITWLGCIAWLGDPAIVDLDGLGTLDAARHFLDPASGDDLTPLLTAHPVRAALIGQSWFGLRGYSGPPSDWILVAEWLVVGRYSGWTLTDDLWATDAYEAARLTAALRDGLDRLPDEVIVVLQGGVRAAASHVEGAAVRQESKRLAFYSNGSAEYVVPVDGDAELTVSGDEAGDGPAHVTITGLGEARVIAVRARPAHLPLGPVHAGDVLRLAYADDLVAPDGRDRNVFVWGVWVVPSRSTPE